MKSYPLEGSGTATRTYVAILCTLAICLSITTFAGYEISKRYAQQQIERTLDSRIEAHKLYFLDNFGKYSLLPEIIATSPAARDVIKRPNKQNVDIANRTLEEIAKNVESDRIWIADARGTTIADSQWQGRNSIMGRNFAYRPYFQDAMASKTGHFIGIGSTSQVVGYFISHPIYAEGKAIGVVTMRKSGTFKTFESILAQNWNEYGELALIADSHGIVFISAIPEWAFRTVSHIGANVLAAIQKTKQYGDRKISPLPATYGDALTDQTRFVRFEEFPGQVFIQKSYEMPETGGRTYLHIDAKRYWDIVSIYTGTTMLAATVFFLCAFLLLQRWKYQKKLIQAALHDPLTGLYTRLYMQDWLRNAINTRKREPEGNLILILLDVDRFKSVNDTYGHITGDEVLKSVAQIIGISIRPGDLAVRFGGEEIAVFASVADIADAKLLAERIRSLVEEHTIHTTQGDVRVTLSGGIATHCQGESESEFFERADKKLYEAKQAGRNRILSE